MARKVKDAMKHASACMGLHGQEEKASSLLNGFSYLTVHALVRWLEDCLCVEWMIDASCCALVASSLPYKSGRIGVECPVCLKSVEVIIHTQKELLIA